MSSNPQNPEPFFVLMQASIQDNYGQNDTFLFVLRTPTYADFEALDDCLYDELIHLVSNYLPSGWHVDDCIEPVRIPYFGPFDDFNIVNWSNHFGK